MTSLHKAQGYRASKKQGLDTNPDLPSSNPLLYHVVYLILLQVNFVLLYECGLLISPGGVHSSTQPRQSGRSQHSRHLCRRCFSDATDHIVDMGTCVTRRRCQNIHFVPAILCTDYHHHLDTAPTSS